MAVRILIIGNDIHIHKLVIDILEITFTDVVIDRATNEDGLFEKLESEGPEFNLLIIDCHNDKINDENLLLALRKAYPHLIKRIILLIDRESEKPDDDILQGMSSVFKPFSLDEFGELVKRSVAENEQ